MKSLINFPSLLILFIVGLGACKRSGDEKGTSLTLKIYDAGYWSASNPKGILAADSSNVQVSIYKTKQDFKDGRPFKSGKTMSGSISFKLPEGKYFIAAIAGNGRSNLYKSGGKNAAGMELGYVYEGIYQSTSDVQSRMVRQQDAMVGYFKWKDINGDGQIDFNDLLQIPAEEITVGSVAMDREIVIGHSIEVPDLVEL